MYIETDTHTHTMSSGHAYSTLHENAVAAKASGLRLMAMTDHAPSMPGAPHIWHFGNLKVVPREIAGVGILRGVEANILNVDGEIDVPDDYLKMLDIVIGSLHEPVFTPGDRTANTKALISVIERGQVDIIGHPGNPHYPIEIDTVVKAAAEHQVMLELNNSSFISSRRGSHEHCLAIARSAAEQGALIALGSDSHISYTVGQFSECLEMIQEAGLSEAQVVSTSAVKLLDLLISRGKNQLTDFDFIR